MTMSISTEIERLKKAKKDLFAAITAKGGILNEAQKLDEYSDAVDMISLSVEGSGKHRVRFFDYDGTILKTVYTDGGAVTAPNVPEHDRLLFQEWNNDFDDITSDLDVGAIYTTKSGKCEFDIWINAQTGSYGNHADKVAYFNPYLVSGTLTIEWGDGIVETLTTAGGTNLTHTYPAYGKYTILVSVSDGGAWRPNTLLFSVNGASGDANNDYSVIDMRLTGFGTSIDVNSPFANLHCCQTVSLARDVAFGNNLSAFERCAALKHVNLPRTQVIRYAMFMNCWSLRSFTFQNGISGGDLRLTFVRCFNLRELLLSGCTPGFAFQSFAQGCHAVTRIDLPRYDGYAHSSFSENYCLSHITIPETVTWLGDSFGGCYSLRTVVMKPIQPPEIDTAAFTTNGAFYGTLKEIIVPTGCGEAYKSATNWSAFADIIKEEEI